MADQLPTIIGDQGPVEALPVVAFNPDGTVSNLQLSPLGYRQIEVPVGQTTAVDDVPDGSRLVLVKIEGAAVRYRDDGIAPTAQVGMPLADGEAMTYDATMQSLQLIGVEAGAICNLAFYGDANG